MAGPSESKMNWLYDEDTAKPKAEDYLLGKAIDANFERGTLGQINAVEYDCTPASIFASKAEHQVDIQRKLQEDPLIALKKTEVDTRKRILDNPLKMKEINSYIEKMKKKKSKKKKKKHKYQGSDDEEDLDALLMAKLSKQLKNNTDADGSDSSSDEESSRRKHEKSPRRRKSPSPERSREKSHKSGRDYERRSHRSPDRGRRDRSPDKVRRDRSPPRRRRASPNRITRSPDRRKRDFKSPDRHHRKRSPTTSSKSTDSKRDHRNSKLSDEEKQKKLREMMSNADWRDEQRTKNVTRYREDEKHEEEAHYSRVHDPEFVTKQLMKAADAGSVEKRIQSNKYNIQRSGMAMDKNFARR